MTSRTADFQFFALDRADVLLPLRDQALLGPVRACPDTHREVERRVWPVGDERLALVSQRNAAGKQTVALVRLGLACFGRIRSSSVETV